MNSPDKFYGRKTSLDLLKRRVLDVKEGYRQNVAFLGERYVGKTELLQKFLSDLDDPALVPVYLDLENKDFVYFCEHLWASLLYQYAKTKGLALGQDSHLLLEGLQQALPHSVKAVKKIQKFLGDGKKKEAYQELIALPQNFAQETNTFCILAFDEFDHLEDLTFPGAFQELGKKIMTQKRCLYLLASSAPVTAKKILSEKLSLLFGNFEVITVQPFDLKTSREYLSQALGELRIKDPLRNFLIDFTGGHPLYLHLICEELLRLKVMHKQNDIFIPFLSQALEDVLFDPWGTLSRHFDLTVERSILGKGNLLNARLLIALAKGKQKLRELALALGQGDHALNQRLHRLMDSGQVVKNGNYYYLPDKMFRYWLAFVFKTRFSPVPRDPSDERKEFAAQLKRAIETFCANEQKDLFTKIMELFYSFENEAFLINGRRYKLPVFRQATPKSVMINQENLNLIQATTNEGEWFIVLKSEKILEQDIPTVLQELKKIHHKPQQCVLISLQELDENVRVRALQERMWIWNQGELNTLLHLYDKPDIMSP